MTRNAETVRGPRWYRRLPEAARNLPPTAYDHCTAKAEVMTPDATLREIYCGKKRQGHGRWHANVNVRWRGKWERPTYMNEYVEGQVSEFSAQIDGREFDQCACGNNKRAVEPTCFDCAPSDGEVTP